jgi:hypothetical protein
MPAEKPTTATPLPTAVPELKTPGLVPTQRLRWLNRGPVIDHLNAKTVFTSTVMSAWRGGDNADIVVLQQWFDIEVPDFMRSAQKTGEWRDVPTVEE